MRVLRAGDGQEITLDGPALGRGGEASVYAVPGRPDLAAKVYHNPTAEHAAKLAALLAAAPVSPSAGAGHVAVAWPVESLLEAEGERGVVGYLMPRVGQARLLWEFYNPGTRRQVCPLFHHGSLVRAARNLACVVRILHEQGYVIGDLNESNVLVTPEALVTLIDVDSFQATAADRVYRCRVGRPEYTPPELQGVAFAEVDRRPEHDSFALAVLIFQLLMQGTHPFAGTGAGDGEPDSIPARIAAGCWPYAWERAGPIRPSPHAPPWFVLPPAVQELLRCCFEDAHAAPTLRPSAAQWQQGLEEAEAGLTACGRNGQHVYTRGLDVCPWCDLAQQQGRDPFPSPEEVRARSSRDREGAVEGSGTPPRSLTVAARTRPVREDPIPSRPAPANAGWVEAVLHRVGAALERRQWVLWCGAALVGTVAGLLWALEHLAGPAGRDDASARSPAPPAVVRQDFAPPTAKDDAPPAESAAPMALPLRPAEPAGERREGPAPPVAARLLPQPGVPNGKTPSQEALEEFQQAVIDYRQAVVDYREAVQDHGQGTVSQQEVARYFHEWQAAMHKLQAAQQALAKATKGP